MVSPFGFTVGIILIAVGAILVWGVTEDANGVNIDAVGWILMIVGAVAALLALVFWSTAGRTGYRRREYVEDDPYYRRPRGRRTVVEEEDPGPPPAY